MLLMALALAGPVVAGDLSAIQNESNAEKRAQKALANASSSLKASQEAYGKGHSADPLLEEVRASVQLAYESLRDTGKNPSKSPKHFKQAEIKTRELLRRLDDFRNEMAADDRQIIDQVRDSVHRVHEDLLLGIMGSKESLLRKKR